MKKFVRHFLLMLLVVKHAGLMASGIDSNKTVFFNRTQQSIRIDGKMDDPAWSEAIAVTDFVQFLPDEGHAPTQKTSVRVLYNNYALFVIAQMYDTHPDSILRELGSRDDEGVNADFFYFGVDPYNSRQDAFVFGVSAAGVQVDYKYNDNTFDAAWYSAVQHNKDGWCAEFMIPYSAIRFPKEAVQKWAVEFGRKIRRNREADQWVLTPNGKANPLRFWGMAKGVENIKSPVRLSFTPYVSSYLIHSRNEGENPTNSFIYNAGTDLKYGLDERFTLDMTLLPDFGQVQSDNKVKNLSYRETVYDENRPFFKEGVDLFNKGNFLFYSRRIGKAPFGIDNVETQLVPGETILENPGQVKLLNATKISGRTNNGLGIGFFNALTDNMYATVEDQNGNKRKILTEPLTNYNLIVLDQQLKNNSSIYFLNTNVARSHRYNNANVTSSGFTFFEKTSTYSLEARASVSQILSKPLDITQNVFNDKMGYQYYVGTKKNSGNFNYELSREVFNHTFDSRDMGYLVVNNYVSHTLKLAYNQYTSSPLLQNSFNNISFNYLQHYLTLQRTGFSIDLSSFNTLHSYHSFFFGGGVSPISSRDYNEPRDTVHFSRTSEFYYTYAGISSDYRKRLAIDLQLNQSDFFSSNYNRFPESPEFGLKSTLRYRFSNNFTLSYKLTISHNPYDAGFATKDSNAIIFGGRKIRTIINTLSGRYIFSNTMFINLNVRHYLNVGEYLDYFTLMNNGDLVLNAKDYRLSYSTNFFNIDFVYSWVFSPGSLLSIVYKTELDRDMLIHEPSVGLQENFRNTIDNPLFQSASLSIKFLYYLDYQNLLRKRV